MSDLHKTTHQDPDDTQTNNPVAGNTDVPDSKQPLKIGKVVVNRDACISAATCVVISPDAFELDSEGIAVVKEGALKVSVDELLMAAQSCPTQAIIIYDELGKQIYPKNS